MKRIMLLVIIVLLAATLGLGRAHAQSGGGYDLTWNTLDGGGYTFSAGGGYSLSGTAGQPDAGVLSGGGYALVGGFWRGGAAAPTEIKVYLPLVIK